MTLQRMHQRRKKMAGSEPTHCPPACQAQVAHSALINNDEVHMINLYDVSGQGMPALPVFAIDYNQAVEIAMAWWLWKNEGPLPDLEVRRRNLRWPGLNADHLMAAIDRNMVGVGFHDQDHGWTIRSPGNFDERLG